MLPFFKAKPKYANRHNYAIRPATPADKEAIIGLIEPYFKEVGLSLDLAGDDKDLTDIERYWRDEKGEFVVITQEDKIIGTLGVRTLKGHPRSAEFDWLYLDKKAVGKGISLLLYEWALDWCLKHNIAAIELWSGEKRLSTHKLYKKMGFVHNGVRKQVRYNPDYYQLFFELDLLKLSKDVVSERINQITH